MYGVLGRRGTSKATLGLSAGSRAIFALRNAPSEDFIMLKWALICAIIAVIAGVLGFAGVAGAAAGIAKFLFFAFLAIFLIVLILGIAAGRKVSSTLRRKD